MAISCKNTNSKGAAVIWKQKVGSVNRLGILVLVIMRWYGVDLIMRDMVMAMSNRGDASKWGWEVDSRGGEENEVRVTGVILTWD
ncbi:hypothetical protein M0R45_016929 [Rubus argutus]|uniref:Uncharacterized protein n=1 Tax=Rubus argutus TaxID=59490 RepID=A0AAW1XTE8_RUBAR